MEVWKWFIKISWPIQDRMVQLMVKGKCGGNFGGIEHWNTPEVIFLK